MFSIFCQVLLCSDYKGVSGVAVIMYSLMWFRLQIKASVRKPLLVPKGEGDKQRLPVVIFSHGMWGCRTSYSSTCIDVASHGYSYGRFLHCSPVTTPFLCASVEHQMNECVYYTCLRIL
jgi:predicted dienelactone hydrolase